MQAITSTAQGGNLLGTLGTVIGGVGNIFQGGAEKQQGDYNAANYEAQAKATRDNAVLNEYQKRRLQASKQGTQIAMYGKAGIKNSGSPLEVQLDSLANSNLDIAIDNYNSDVKARGYQSDADMARYEAKQNKSMSYVKAGQSFIGAAAQLYTSQKEIGGGKK